MKKSFVSYKIINLLLGFILIFSSLLGNTAETVSALMSSNEYTTLETLPNPKETYPTDVNCEIQDGKKKGPDYAPTPFFYLPYSATSFDVTHWNSQMDHSMPNYDPDGVVYTLGEKLSYMDHTPAYLGDTREPLLAGTWAWPQSGSETFFDHNTDPTTKRDPNNQKPYMLYYESRWLANVYEQGDVKASYLGYDGHDGQDFGVTGDALAAAGGEVIRAVDTEGLLGNIIEIYHPEGYLTRYAHLDSFYVKKGDKVVSGQKIGVIGGSGGWLPHLHFSVYRWDGKKWQVTDPFGWDPYASTSAQENDPLKTCNGEISYNLWYGLWPRPYNNALSLNLSLENNNTRPTNDSYLGGWLGDTGDNLLNQLDSSSLDSVLYIPDGTIVTSGQSLTKAWRMKNTGTSTWGNGYQLVFTDGEKMGAPAAINVPSTAPNQTADLSVSITAPSTAGLHQGYWQLRNPQGTYFGPKIWVKINVVSSTSTHITLLETDPASPATTNMVRIHARVENFSNFRAMRVKVDGVIKGEIGAPEIWMEWNTAGYQNGAHSIIVEVASNSDPNWVNPEVRGTAFFLEGNSVSTNHAPNPPLLSNPGDWAVFEGTGGINLSAQQNGDPDNDVISQYYFEIYNSHDIPNSGWINTNTWSPPGLSTYGYQWRVKVRDAYGAESGWSETRHFNVNDPNPQIYSFSSETCRPAWNQGDPDKICFCAQTNAGGLQLQINSAADGSANGTWKIINELASSNYNCSLDTDSPPTIDPKELESGTHRVRLYARKYEAAKTQDITISVGNLRPNPPSASSLTNGVYTNSQNVTLAWQGTQRTTNYRVEVSQDSSFSSRLVDQTLPSTQTKLDISLASPFPNIYWRVTSIGPYGTNSSTNLFHIDNTPPDTSLSVPASVVFENNFAISWGGSDSSAGIQQYHIQVLDQSKPDGTWGDWLVNTTQTAALFTGQAGHTYLFRIRGMDKVGNWEGWPSSNGTRQAAVKIDPSAVPPAPWWNTSYAYKRNLVLLNNDSDGLPAHYPMHIHFDSSTTPTAAEIYNASLAGSSGNDIRVVYNNATDLNRFVQRFGSDQIDIWFPLQVDLGGGGTDNTRYQLYYGNATPGTPLADINSTFLPIADANTVGLWHFQEGSGGTVTDFSGRGHNGAFNSAAWVNGQTGWAGLFNGTGSYVDVGNSNDFNLAAGPMTIEAWIYLTSAGNFPFIVSKWGPGDGSYFFRLMGGAKNLHFSTRGGGELSTGEIIQLNQWYHVAATYDGTGVMRIFVNGVQQAVKPGVTDGLSTARRLFIGWAEQGADGGYFPGYIQHMRISNIARTDFPYARIDIQPSVAAGSLQVPPVVGKPDLAIQSLYAYPNPGGGVLVEAVVQNQGPVSTLNGFYTDLYLNHLPTGSGDYTGSLQFWVNDPIPAGGTTSLITVITNLSALGAAVTDSSVPAESSGTLYIQTDSTGVLVEPDKQNNINASGVQICTAQSDAFGSDNTYATASTIALGTPQIHNFDIVGDQDWVKFTTTSGKRYLITTSELGAASDTYLYLYGTDGVTLLASNDDYGNTLASQIEWQAPASGTFYILVSNWNPNVGGCGTQYSLTISEATPTGIFADVPTSYWAWQWIERLYNAGVTGGCTLSPLQYCPTKPVTRAQMAIFLLRAKHGKDYVPPAATGIFGDVPVDSTTAPWIEQLYNEGITGGCSKSPLLYCPGNPVTRAQMAIFLLRAEHGSDYTPPAATGIFGDVDVNSFTAPFIEQLSTEGITGGCSTSPMLYCPAKTVTRDQMAVFLVRTFSLP